MTEGFKVEVHNDHQGEGFWVSVTHNGSAWSSLHLYDVEQAKAVVKELVTYFGKEVLP